MRVLMLGWGKWVAAAALVSLAVVLEPMASAPLVRPIR